LGDLISSSEENKKMQQITIKLKVDDLNRLREYADKKGGNPVTHYIREAVSEYLEKHYK
jgi:predicted DNA binding CopG/RHH family protein